MLEISRAAASRFRAPARRCVVGRPRGPAPPVLVTQTVKTTSFFCNLGEVAVALAWPGGGDTSFPVAVPASLLEEIESAKGRIATIDVESRCCRWDGRESSWQPIVLEENAGPCPQPRETKPVPPALFAALHECGRSAARDSVRFALKRIQLQGHAGQIVSSDGCQLLLWKGFHFPFGDSVLVPAIPLFGCKELLSETEIRIGQSDRHIVVTAGPWTIWLAIDRDGRFPNVASIIPKSFDGEVRLTEDDCQIARSFLKQVIKEEDSHPTVTIEIADRPTLRAKTDTTGQVSDVVLESSKATGEAGAWAFNRDHLTRALALGLRHIGLQTNSGPAVCRDQERTYVMTTLHPSLALPPLSPRLPTSTRMTVFKSDQGESMPCESNGRGAPETASAEALDFLAEAEALRDALGEVARRSARLVGSLKQLQKQRRVLETAWSSLKNLRLGS